MKKISKILIAILFALPTLIKAADPSVAVYIDHATYTSANIYEFDIMMKATGATTTLDLRTFQSGLYINAAWLNGGTITIQNVPTYSEMSLPAYNGVFSYNTSNSLINCSVNIGVRPTTGSCISTAVTTTPVNVTRLRITNSADFSCASTPDIKFNYVNNSSPLRLRTSFSWRQSGCTTNYDMFYPGRTYTGASTFNGETYSINDADGKSPVSTSPLANTGFCFDQLTLTALLEGYYLGSGQMNPVLYNQGVKHASQEQTDTIEVDFNVSSPTPLVYTTKAVLQTNGTAYCLFPTAATNQIGLLEIKHRNSLQTWSSHNIKMISRLTYDFSRSDTATYGNNIANMGGSRYALYTGDLNQDESIDPFDFPSYDYDNLRGAFTEYLATDFNGDGSVDPFDFPVFDANNLAGLYSIHP